MIVIEKPQIMTGAGKARLSAFVRIPELAYRTWVLRIGSIERYTGYEKMYQYTPGGFELWYETSVKNMEGLCAERSDAFVMAILYFAMVTGEDIYSQAPVSNELCHNLNTYVIPMQCNERSGYRPIQVMGETVSEALKTLGENGTGISCGVDSLDTVFRYLEKCMDPAHRLTCLCLFNAGAYHNMPEMKACISGDMTIREWDERAHGQFIEACEVGKKVADELGLRFVSVDSNISDLYQGVFLQSHGYRNCSVVFALEKLFGCYYYASAGEPEKPLSGLEKDASDNVWLFSDETVKFYAGSLERTRIEKINYLADHELAKKYLHVCCRETYNCGKCGKCIRTLIILDLIGKLGEFAAVFRDVEYYKKKKWKKFVWVLDKKKEDQFAADMLEYVKKNRIQIPVIAWIYHSTYPIRRFIRRTVRR